jgi:hypothetical protein
MIVTCSTISRCFRKAFALDASRIGSFLQSVQLDFLFKMPCLLKRLDSSFLQSLDLGYGSSLNWFSLGPRNVDTFDGSICSFLNSKDVASKWMYRFQFANSMRKVASDTTATCVDYAIRFDHPSHIVTVNSSRRHQRLDINL